MGDENKRTELLDCFKETREYDDLSPDAKDMLEEIFSNIPPDEFDEAAKGMMAEAAEAAKAMSEEFRRLLTEMIDRRQELPGSSVLSIFPSPFIQIFSYEVLTNLAAILLFPYRGGGSSSSFLPGFKDGIEAIWEIGEDAEKKDESNGTSHAL